jgi:mediator of RNA polymerase II transcription subunit 31
LSHSIRFRADLAQGQYFDEPAFVNYLAYLLYWKRPEYAHFIVYPQCLHFLELLQSESFRKELANPQFVDAVLYRQQFNHWRFHASNRWSESMRRFEQQAQAAKDAAAAAEAAAASAASDSRPMNAH